MLNFIDPQWEILFSFAVLDENQKVSLGYKTAPVAPLTLQCAAEGPFRVQSALGWHGGLNQRRPL